MLGQPVYNLIGGLVRERIACYPHNEGEDDPPALIDDIERTVGDGWRFARWGFSGTTGEAVDPSDAVRKSIRAIEAVRGHFGDELELCVDVHTRVELPHAIRYCRAVEDTNPFFIEDALRSERPESYRRLRERTSVPLAAGEQWFSKWGFASAIEEELIDYARIDLCIVGGLTEALKIARWAETHHIQIAPHNPLGPVSSAAGAHLTLAAANAGVLEMARRARHFARGCVPATNAVRARPRAAHRSAWLGHHVRPRSRRCVSRASARLRAHLASARRRLHQLVATQQSVVR